MPTKTEVERLHETYRQYGERETRHPKWCKENAGNQAIIAERTSALEALLRSSQLLPFHDQQILDVGCGTGAVLDGLRNWGAKPENLFGVDLLQERVEQACQRFP